MLPSSYTVHSTFIEKERHWVEEDFWDIWKFTDEGSRAFAVKLLREYATTPIGKMSKV